MFTVTHFYFLFFPCLTLITYGSSGSSGFFFFSFIFSHQAFSFFYSLTTSFSGSEDCWELFFLSIWVGTYSPRVGNNSLIFFWYVTGLDFASLTSYLSDVLSSWDFWPITSSGKSPLSWRLKLVFVVNPIDMFFFYNSLSCFLAFFSPYNFSNSTFYYIVFNYSFLRPYFSYKCGLSYKKSSRIFSWILCFSTCISLVCLTACSQYFMNT